MGNPVPRNSMSFGKKFVFCLYRTAVHKRRHNTVSYLVLAICVRELIERVKKRPVILTPWEEWVRLQFSPINPYTNNAMKYTGRFEIKYTVQKKRNAS